MHIDEILDISIWFNCDAVDTRLRQVEGESESLVDLEVENCGEISGVRVVDLFRIITLTG